MIAWTNGDTVRLVESDQEFREILAQVDRNRYLRYELRMTRNWLAIVSLVLLATWFGIAYVWLVNH